LLPEFEFEEVGAGDGIEAVGRNFLEAEGVVQGLGFGHLRESVEAHGLVTDFAGCVDDGCSELAAEAVAAGIGANVEAFHFAGCGVHAAQGDAAGGGVSGVAECSRVIDEREKQAPVGWGVVAGKACDFCFEVLEIEVDAECDGVFAEERGRLSKVTLGSCWNDLMHGISSA
jgi:hypothetical protein